MSEILIIKNNGQEILETNYWSMPHAKNGFCYLSWNAGAARLLVPLKMTPAIAEMKTGKSVEITYRDDMIDIMFDDASEYPFVISIKNTQTDIKIPGKDKEKKFIFSVWTKNGKQAEFPGTIK